MSGNGDGNGRNGNGRHYSNGEGAVPRWLRQNLTVVTTVGGAVFWLAWITASFQAQLTRHDEDIRICRTDHTTIAEMSQQLRQIIDQQRMTNSDLDRRINEEQRNIDGVERRSNAEDASLRADFNHLRDDVDGVARALGGTLVGPKGR